MVQCGLIVHNASQIVTCASSGAPKRGEEMLDPGAIANGAVAIEGSSIVAAGPSAEIMSRYEPGALLDAGGGVVCPAFVDPHTHVVFAGDRLNEFELKIKGTEYLDILAAGGGIISTVRHTRDASEGELVALTAKRLDKMLACGTTVCEIKTGYGLNTETELKMLRVMEQLDRSHAVDIVPTFLPAHAVPPEFRDNADGYVDLICDEMLPRAWEWYTASTFQERLPFFCDVFCEKGAFSVDQSRRVLTTARELGFALKAHVDEFVNLGGSRMAIELGAVSIDHLDAISDDEVRLLAGSGTTAIVTPAVNFNFGSSSFADPRRLVDSGCAVALATDYNPGSAPCPSQLMAMALACRYQKLLPAEAMNAATVNAAHAVGLGAFAGSIELGKWADLAIYDPRDYRELCYEFGAATASTVTKKGAIVHPA